jgi:hypothetical protein
LDSASFTNCLIRWEFELSIHLLMIKVLVGSLYLEEFYFVGSLILFLKFFDAICKQVRGPWKKLIVNSK